MRLQDVVGACDRVRQTLRGPSRSFDLDGHIAEPGELVTRVLCTHGVKFSCESGCGSATDRTEDRAGNKAPC
jgi:hypothetical protein